MGSPGKRTRTGRREPLVDTIERWGHAVLTWVWTWFVWLAYHLLRAAGRLAMSALRWFSRQRPVAQLVMVALLGAGSVAAAHVLRTRPLFEPVIYVDDETEALARVIHSEAGTSSIQQRIHVAWVTRNLARERRQTVARMACSPCGEQEAGRPVSSRQDANDLDRQLARHILQAPDFLDPTGGATHFINPLLQDDLASRGRPGYRGRPYNEVRQRWMQGYGWEPYYRLGPDLELWGPRRRARGRAGARTSAK